MEQNLVKNNWNTIQDALTENKFNERDSDINCITSVLQLKGINPDQISLSQYLQRASIGDAPWIESITRIRRLMQKLDPALRGKSEKVRKGYRKNKVKQEIREVTDEQTGQISYII